MIIDEKIKEQLKNEFLQLKEPVNLVLKSDNSQNSLKIEKLLEEIASLSEKITFLKEDFDTKYSPCIAINWPEKETGIRFAGIPVGGEFKTFIDSIIMVSRNEYDISERILEFLEEIDKPVDIKIFITNSCGWCPPAIKKAYSFALANDFIKATAIDCYLFQEEALKYNVSAVPKIVINDKVEFVGVREDNEFFGYIISAIER